MSNRQRIKQMTRSCFLKMKMLDNSTPELIRKNAWEISAGKKDWERKIIYGKLMKRFATPDMKRQYAKRKIKRQKNEFGKAFLEWKEDG